MDVSAQLPALPEQPSPPGAVVLHNGRLAGTRRALKRPLTLLGQALTCDVRLQEDGIAPFHCAIVHESTGPLLRDLSGVAGTRVNGQVVQSQRLANGDSIEIGSLRLLVELETPPTSEAASADAVLLEREREALRVQVAAVAAQQAALSEEEARLEQRATALARQEAQIARHLEERQGALDEEQDRLRQEREAFEEQSAETRIELESASKEAAQERASADLQRREGEVQRRRLNDLRKKLWARYQRYWQGRDESARRREADLQAREARIEERKQVVEVFFARVNGERELSQRQLREEAQALALAQQRWQEGLEQDRLEQNRRQAEFDQRASELESANQALVAEQARWQQEQQRLERECRGLETRVRNLRDQAQAIPIAETSMESFTPLPMAPALLATEPNHLWPDGTRHLAGMLSDQRTHLAEQWRLLLEIHKGWQEERVSALDQLDEAAGQLLLRERELSGSESRVRHLTADLEQRQERLGEVRAELESWKARLVIEQSDWQTQRDEALADLEERERGLGVQRQQFDEERRRHDCRATEELTALREARERCEEARRQYSELWQDCEELRAALAEQERRLAADTLAIRQVREELVHSSANSVRVEGRLEKLARHEATRLDAEMKAVAKDRLRLEEERARLDEAGKLLGQQEAAFLARQRDWSRQAVEWDQRRVGSEQEEVQRGREVGRLRARHAAQERQLRQLRDELERLARVLIDDVPEQAASRAA